VSTKVQGIYPPGNARAAWKNLLKKYTPTTSFALSTLHKKFSSAKLKKGCDPDLYMVYLQDIRQKMSDMGHVYTDHQYMLQILSNLTDDYEVVVYFLNHRLSDLHNPLTIDEMRDELSARYELIKNKFPPTKKEGGGGSGEESALYAGARFKGKCLKCGKYGHKRNDCKEGNKTGTSPNANTTDNKPDAKPNNNNNQKFKGNCNYCNKPGHKEAQCFKKKAAETANAASGDSTEGTTPGVSFTVIDAMFLGVGNSKNMWIGDTGASCHMTCSDQGMYDCVDIDDPICVGDGKVIKATKMGSKKVWGKQKNGKDFHLTIHNCKYVPDLWVNLLSITSTLANGWQLSNKGLIMKISKNNDALEFDQVYNTDIGAVVGVIMYPDTKNTNIACPAVVEEIVNPGVNKVIKVSTVDINIAHKLLGHVVRIPLNVQQTIMVSN
jgi:hypothetical protein